MSEFRKLIPLSPTPFAGKVVSITGGASGIGFATALVLYSRGATVAVADINPEGLKHLEKALEERSKTALPGQKWSTTIVDVTQDADVQAWIDGTIQKFGRLDSAANIAGAIHTPHSMADTSIRDFEFSFDVNTKGVYNCMRAQLPHLQRGSSIINVSSISAIRVMPGLSLYGASKAAVGSLTAAAATEYGPEGIRVNAIAPGITLTPPVLTVGRQYLQPSIEAAPLKRAAEPVEISKVIAFLLSDEASYISGVVLRCDGGAMGLGF